MCSTAITPSRSARRRTDRRRLRQRQILTAGRDFARLPAVQPAQLQRLRRQHRRRLQRRPPHRRQVRPRRLGSAQRRRHQPGDVPARRRHRVVGRRGHLRQRLRPHRHRPGAQMAHRRVPQRLVEPVRPRRRRPRHRGRLQPLGVRPLRRRRLQGDDWRFSTKVESQYLAQLYATIGIRASDAAQQLLGKAKSLKSVGGLEQFVREFMLDEPDSLARLPEALKQIDPLVEARELLAVAQKKRKILGDIETDPAPLRLRVLRPRHHRPGRRADGAGVHRPRPARPVPRADRDAGRHHRPARERVRGRHPPAQSGQGRSGFAQRADQRIQRQHRPTAVAGGRRRDRGRAGGAPPRRLRRPAHRPGRRDPGHRRRVLEPA